MKRSSRATVKALRHLTSRAGGGERKLHEIESQLGRVRRRLDGIDQWIESIGEASKQSRNSTRELTQLKTRVDDLVKELSELKGVVMRLEAEAKKRGG